MRKTLLAFLSVLLLVVLVACKPPKNTAPTLSGVANTSSPYGLEFDPLKDVTAYDEEDGDLTDKIKVTGELDPFTVGEYTFEYSVEDSGGLKGEATRVVSVLPLTEATLANGWYDYKFATADIKHTFFAAAERWLLENAYAGIPLAAQSGLTLQHDRIVLPVEDFIPTFGWGTSYATLTKDDLEVAMENGTGGEVGQLDLVNTVPVAGNYTYRSWTQSEPETLNYWQGKSTTESDYGSYINGSFYSMALNDTATGWEFVPALAEGEPIPVNGVEVNGKMTSRIWQIPLRDNLQWAYNVGTDTSAFPEGHEKLDAHDFIYTYRLALNEEWFRAVQGGGDFVTQKIKGAEAYSAAVARGASESELDALWADFGIKASPDGLTLTVEYLEPMSLFNFKYSFGWPAVHQDIYEANPTLFGTEPKHVASSGMYRIIYWEDGVGSRYEKVATHPRASQVSWTHESLRILEGTSSQDNAFQAFENGLLDSVGIPNSRVDEFKEDPRVLRTPGESVWSLNINMTGSVQAQQAQWPGSTHVPVPILGSKDFRLALYFSLNRDQMVQYDAKTYPTGMKISQAYYVDPEEGIPYRMTEQGVAVGENLAYSTNGYDPEAAQLLFERAVAAEIAAGRLEKGTAENYTEIVLEVLTFDADSGSAIADNWMNFAKDGFETLIDNTNFVKVVMEPKHTPGSQIYDLIEAGDYDLALSSISGNPLDASSFLDIFITDNRSGFLLNYGYDSSVPEIEVRWTDNGVEHFELFSFNGIYEVLNSKVFIKDGNKITEFGSVDSIIEIYLGERELTEVSRSEEDGDALMEILYPEYESEADVVMPIVVLAKDEDGKEARHLLIITKTGSIYELAESRTVVYEPEMETILDEQTAELTDPVKEEVSEEEFEALNGWFEFDVDIYDEVHAFYFTTSKERLLVVVGEVEGLFFFVATEELVVATEDVIADAAAELVGEYGYQIFNLRQVLDDEGLAKGGYLASSYGIEGFADIPNIFSGDVDVDWIHVYEFDNDNEGTQRPDGDVYLLFVIVAGHLVFQHWL